MCVVVKTSVVRGAVLLPAQIYSIIVHQDNDNLLSWSEPSELNPAKLRLHNGNNRGYAPEVQMEVCP